MPQKRSPKSRPWTVSILTNLRSLTTDQMANLVRVKIGVKIMEIEDVGWVPAVVLTTTRPYWAQTAHAAVGYVLRNIWSADVTDIHRAAIGITVSEAERWNDPEPSAE